MWRLRIRAGFNRTLRLNALHNTPPPRQLICASNCDPPRGKVMPAGYKSLQGLRLDIRASMAKNFRKIKVQWVLIAIVGAVFLAFVFEHVWH
jgi:hypothetical protein